MFSLMDKVPSGIEPMLKDLEEHIINAGLADMVAVAETITSVRAQAIMMNFSCIYSANREVHGTIHGAICKEFSLLWNKQYL